MTIERVAQVRQLNVSGFLDNGSGKLKAAVKSCRLEASRVRMLC